MSAFVSEYLISHGCAAALTRCRDRAGVDPERGDRVVIQSARGLELGEVLCAATPAHAALSPTISEGLLLRVATSQDESAARGLSRRAAALLDDAQRLIESQNLPLLPLDADLLLDGTRGFLRVLRWDACTLTPLLEELRRGHGLFVTIQDVSRAEAEHDHGCSSCGGGGCGSCAEGGCSTGGCGSGSCSSGAVKSAAELTAYFAQLREQMQAAIPRVPLV
jgi:hypothetical protein